MDPPVTQDAVWYVEWFWRSIGIAGATVLTFFGYVWRAVTKNMQKSDLEIDEIRKMITELNQKLAEQQLRSVQNFVTREEVREVYRKLDDMVAREDRLLKMLMDRFDTIERRLWPRSND